MTSSHHAPYVQGCKHATMLGTKGCDPARGSESQKAGLSSDRGLQPDPVKLESLVIADQHCGGEYVPGGCTHRPAHHESGPHRKGRLDHLLSKEPFGTPILIDVPRGIGRLQVDHWLSVRRFGASGTRCSALRVRALGHLENSIASASIYNSQVMKGLRWMPWRQEPMKDVSGCEKLRGAAERALIRRCPNGETRPGSCPVTRR